MLLQQASTIAVLARIDHAQMTIAESIDGKPQGHITIIVGPVEIYLPLSSLVDLEEERARFQKDLKETETQIVRLEELLAGPFAEKAPEAVVQNEQEKLEGYRDTAEKISAQLKGLNE